jgi:hypothetical protein
MRLRPVPSVLHLAAAFALLGLSACPGTLEIWGINVPLPDDDSVGDDDDATADWSLYDGVEFIHVDWHPQYNEDGYVDCAGEWTAAGDETTGDDANLCPDCDFVWTITLDAEPEAYDCLNQGTGMDVQDGYVRKVGIEFLDAEKQDFRYYRNRENQDLPLAPVGIGAVNGTEFTWSGVDGFSSETDRYVWYFAGEGEF